MYIGLYIFIYIMYIHVSQTIHYVPKCMSYHEAHLTPPGLYIQTIYTSIYRSVETRGVGRWALQPPDICQIRSFTKWKKK